MHAELNAAVAAYYERMAAKEAQRARDDLRQAFRDCREKGYTVMMGMRYTREDLLAAARVAKQEMAGDPDL